MPRPMDASVIALTITRTFAISSMPTASFVACQANVLVRITTSSRPSRLNKNRRSARQEIAARKDRVRAKAAVDKPGPAAIPVAEGALRPGRHLLGLPLYIVCQWTNISEVQLGPRAPLRMAPSRGSTPHGTTKFASSEDSLNSAVNSQPPARRRAPGCLPL